MMVWESFQAHAGPQELRFHASAGWFCGSLLPCDSALLLLHGFSGVFRPVEAAPGSIPIDVSVQPLRRQQVQGSGPTHTQLQVFRSNHSPDLTSYNSLWPLTFVLNQQQSFLGHHKHQFPPKCPTRVLHLQPRMFLQLCYRMGSPRKVTEVNSLSRSHACISPACFLLGSVPALLCYIQCFALRALMHL